MTHSFRPRTCAAVALAVLAGALSTSSALNAQSACNTSPNAPSSIKVGRSDDAEVVVAWAAPSAGCAPTRYYVDASHPGSTTTVEANTTTTATVLPLAKVDAIWRIAVRSFNENGLSSVHVQAR